MVRQIILDLEAGDFCKQNQTSLEKSIADFKKLVETQKQQITTLQVKVGEYEDVYREKENQIALRDKEINVLEKEKKAKFWNGLGFGAAGGVLATALLFLL